MNIRFSGEATEETFAAVLNALTGWTVKISEITYVEVL